MTGSGGGPSDHLRIRSRSGADRVVIELAGELDLAAAPLLGERIAAADVASAPALVLDLRELEFVDSAGLRMILLAHAGARERGRRFALTRGSPQVQRLLALAGLDGRLPTVEHADDPLVPAESTPPTGG